MPSGRVEKAQGAKGAHGRVSRACGVQGRFWEEVTLRLRLRMNRSWYPVARKMSWKKVLQAKERT